MTDSTQLINTTSCLGRTCLKWGADGELTALDLELVMERLAQVDHDVASLRQQTSNPQPCPSIS
jgi:hypothetical protein